MDKETPEQFSQRVKGMYRSLFDSGSADPSHELARVKRERDEAVEMASLIENYLGFHEGSQAKQTPDGEPCVVINYEDFLDVLRSARTFLSKIGAAS